MAPLYTILLGVATVLLVAQDASQTLCLSVTSCNSAGTKVDRAFVRISSNTLHMEGGTILEEHGSGA